MSQKIKNTKKKFQAGKQAKNEKKNLGATGVKAGARKVKPDTKAKSGMRKAEPATQQKPDVPGEWLYMCPKELNVLEIRQSFGADSNYDIEVWDEAGVLEISMAEKSSFDMEATEIHSKDEITKAFANERGVKSVFLVTFQTEDYDEAEKIMQIICDACGGFFCGDTENFMPVLERHGY